MKSFRLSKSKYLSGLQCQKRLWLEIHQPELAPPPPLSQQRIFDQGTLVGDLAREQFPDGTLIDTNYKNINKAIIQTKESLERLDTVIFEGCFVFDDVLVRPDVLYRDENGDWEIIEVKSSVSVKPENLHDVAVQTYVLRGSGINIKRMYLMHINRDCIYPNLDNLFRREDITHQVEGLLSTVSERLTNFRDTLKDDKVPDISIGQHCSTPYECPFNENCWNWIPEYSIFNIPRLRWDVKERFLKKGNVSIEKVMGKIPFSDSQANFIESYKTKKPVIDDVGIREELDKLVYPLHFLDFETDNPAIPRFDGMHPYEQFPFQFSCHVLDENGNLSHIEFLEEFENDPRKPLLESLVNTIGGKGSVIAYNAGFEKGVLNKLATWYPNYSGQIQSIIERLWDQLIIFRKHYCDYRFRGSNSLKRVLPVLIPSMSYEDLDVKEGGEAQVTWNEMIQLDSGTEKDKLIKELKEYCGQDTLAMVEILKRLNHNQKTNISRDF